jgi:hypothetical protein
MTPHQDIHRIIEQAKQQRAEYIGAALKKNMVPIALAAALSLVLLQFTWDSEPQEVAESQVVTRALI